VAFAANSKLVAACAIEMSNALKTCEIKKRFMRRMKPRIGKRCDVKDSLLCQDRLHSRVFIRLSPLEGERIEVRGFQLQPVQMQTLTLTLSLEKGGANRATPLQLMVSPDLVRWHNSWPHSENRT